MNVIILQIDLENNSSISPYGHSNDYPHVFTWIKWLIGSHDYSAGERSSKTSW